MSHPRPSRRARILAGLSLASVLGGCMEELKMPTDPGAGSRPACVVTERRPCAAPRAPSHRPPPRY